VSDVVLLRNALTKKQQALVALAYQAGLVEKRAALHARRYLGLITLDECVRLGSLGLTEAARTYRDELGLFTDFARRRVDGAILDGVRAEAPHARASRAAHRAAASLLGLYRDDFNAIGHDKAELERRFEKMSDDVLTAAFLGAVEDAKRGPGGEGEGEGEESVILREEHARALAMLDAAMAKLPSMQRQILAHVYRDQRTMTELPEVLGISYVTVRRHHEAALAGLRKRLEAMGVMRSPTPRDDAGSGSGTGMGTRR
jgi:RNA polymerase sigma factor (sigma-70 family)